MRHECGDVPPKDCIVCQVHSLAGQVQDLVRRVETLRGGKARELLDSVYADAKYAKTYIDAIVRYVGIAVGEAR